MIKRALSIRRKLLSKDNVLIAVSLNSLGAVYESKGFYTRARILYNHSLTIYKKSWLMLCFRVLFDQQLNQRVQQGFATFTDIMDELEKTKIQRKLFL